MGNGQRKWTVMVYLAGDNNLDSAGVVDLKEMKKVGSTDDVAVVAQFDRVGNKGTTKRYYLRKNGTLEDDVVVDLGETNTGDPRVLEDFILWAASKNPAEHYMTVIWNHGSGWDDDNVYRVGSSLGRDIARRGVTVSDTRFGAPVPFSTARAITRRGFRRALFRPSVEKAMKTRAIAFDDGARDFLDNIEMKQVFSSVRKKLGRKIDVLGMDACLMNMLEVHYQVKDQALYCVGSEETEPGDGWPYDTVLAALAAKPAMTPRDLSALAVGRYLKSYRASDNVTQSTCDTGKAKAVAAAVDRLARLLTSGLSNAAVRMSVIEARSRVQSYYTPDYVDLADLCLLLMQLTDKKEIKTACQAVIDALMKSGMVIKSGYKGPDVSHSHGVSIYFPTKRLSPLYARLDFAKKTKWAGFLAAYLGRMRRK
ncbi:MAG: clostripain-related cysteine peptidase [Nitrospiraceae bacterium]|nr:clostripain-related cysteine peptidase [Nitrospiraceae bacterium]